MATAQQRTPRDVVEFAPNTPVTVALKYGQGKIVSGQYGERVLFTLADNRVMFLDPATAGQIEAAGVNVRENFTITLRWDGKGPRTWEVARLAGEQPDGTFHVPVVKESLTTPAVSPKPPMSAGSATGGDTRARGAEVLIAESIALVDAYAAVLNHALTAHNGRVKPDEVKSIFLTCVINLAGGKIRAA